MSFSVIHRLLIKLTLFLDNVYLNSGHIYSLLPLRGGNIRMVSCFTHESKLTYVAELEILPYVNFALVSNCLNKEI